MSFKKAVYDYLTGTTTVTTYCNGKVYPLIAPTSANPPYIIFYVVGQETIYSMGAVSDLLKKNLSIKFQ